MKNKKKKLYTLEEVEKAMAWTDEEKKEIERMSEYMIMLMDLRAQRRSLKLTQEKLSKLSGVSRPMISKIELGNRNATIDTLMKVAQGMGKTLQIRFV
jgi:DNA-binding XRE family transcriptional regulator